MGLSQPIPPRAYGPPHGPHGDSGRGRGAASRGPARQPPPAHFTFATTTNASTAISWPATAAPAEVASRAWCLVPNHVDLFLVPQTNDSPVRALGDTHRVCSHLVSRASPILSPGIHAPHKSPTNCLLQMDFI